MIATKANWNYKSLGVTNYEAVKNTEWYVSLGLITEDTFNSYIAAGIPLYVKGATEDSYVSSEVYNIDNIYYKKTGWNNSDINNYALSNSDNLTDAVVKLEYRMNKALDTINMSGMKKLEGENIDTTIINTDTLGEVISKLIYRIEQLEAKINESGS